MSTQILYYSNKDISGGINNWIHPRNIADNSVVDLQNGDISTPGKRVKRTGYELLSDMAQTKAIHGLGVYSTFITAQAGTIWYTVPSNGTEVQIDTGFTEESATFITCRASGGGVMVFRVSASDNTHSLTGASTVVDYNPATNTNPPKAIDGIWCEGRLFLVGSTYKDYVYFSDKNDPVTFDQSANAIKVSTGDNYDIKKIVHSGEHEILVFKDKGVHVLRISGTPENDWSTDEIDPNITCMAGKSVVKVGKDIFFLSHDGVRSYVRTVAGQIEGTPEPISKGIQGYIDNIKWQYAYKACACYFNNKYYLAVPYDASTVNNYVFVYDFLSKGWSVYPDMYIANWIVKDFGTGFKLYGGESQALSYLYEMNTGYNDNDTAIIYQEDTKEIDFSNIDYRYGLVDKTGEFLEVECVATGDYNLQVWAQIDENGFFQLKNEDGEDMNLGGNEPSLPISLPFTFGSPGLVHEKFDLSFLGAFRTIQFRFIQSGVDEEVQILSWRAVAYAEELEFEEEE